MRRGSHLPGVTLIEVENRLRRLDWLKVELGLISVFHLAAGFTIGVAPEQQVVTTGTRQLFMVWPELFTVSDLRFIWAMWFVWAGVFSAVLFYRVTLFTQLATWLTVAPLNFMWLGVLSIAVTQGGGSALGVVVWLVLLCWWATVAVRLALGGTGDQCGGS